MTVELAFRLLVLALGIGIFASFFVLPSRPPLWTDVKPMRRRVRTAFRNPDDFLDTPFTAWWRDLNAARAKQGKPEALFGEARKAYVLATRAEPTPVRPE